MGPTTAPGATLSTSAQSPCIFAPVLSPPKRRRSTPAHNSPPLPRRRSSTAAPRQLGLAHHPSSAAPAPWHLANPSSPAPPPRGRASRQCHYTPTPKAPAARARHKSAHPVTVTTPPLPPRASPLKRKKQMVPGWTIATFLYVDWRTFHLPPAPRHSGWGHGRCHNLQPLSARPQAPALVGPPILQWRGMDLLPVRRWRSASPKCWTISTGQFSLNNYGNLCQTNPRE